MKRKYFHKAFVYFLSVSFLSLMSGFPGMIVEAKELPIGEMISRGEVKFESKENVWKKVDPSHFPIFQGVKIKTEDGASVIALANNSQIEAGQDSLFSFDQNDRLHLYQGAITFRVTPAAELSFRVGNLIVTKSRSLQASKGSIVATPKNEETIGSLTLHKNGAVTIKSVQGPLSILTQDGVVLAALSSRESVTIPSINVKTPPRVMVAQAGETGRTTESKKFPWGWVGGGVAVAVGIVIALAAGGGDGGGDGFVCR